MNLLAIETSTRNYSIAVSAENRLVASTVIHSAQVLSDTIIESIDQTLKKARVPLKNINGFIVGLGPGSFTSLRVGLSTIKGFAYATKNPVVGIGSLDLLSKQVQKSQATSICALMDAKRKLFYSCFYDTKSGQLKKRASYALLKSEDVLAHVKDDTVFIGDGINLIETQIKEWGRKKRLKISFAPKKKWTPHAETSLLMALEYFQKKKFLPLNKLNPIYLYPDDCQISK